MKAVIIILEIIFAACLTSHVLAAPDNAASRFWYKDIYEKVQMRGDILGYLVLNGVEDSDLNPSNILGIPGKQFEMIVRPDFYLNLEDYSLAFGCKPRFFANLTTWDDGVYKYKSREGDGEAYIHEWMVRYGIAQRLFVFGARENLQWGPSFLFSPSNPFLKDNGRNNPYLELPGLDYVKTVWIISNVWTYSMIANVGEGRSEPMEKFRNTYALKLDYTGFEKYLSLITSKKEKEEPVVGFFGGLTLTDYLLLHMEGNFSWETDKADILLGTSYTLTDGSALTLEYFYQGSGCTQEPISRCLISKEFYDELQTRFETFEGTIDELLREVESLDFGVNPNYLIRRQYLMVQYVKPRIKDRLTLTGRWIYNINDGSSRMIGIGSWEINNHFSLVAVGNIFTGGSDTEYGSLLNHSLMLGGNYHF